MPIIRRALPVRCGTAGALTPAFFLQTEKGARVLPFSAAGGMPFAMLAFPKMEDFLALATASDLDKKYVTVVTVLVATFASRCTTIAFVGGGVITTRFLN